MKYVVRLSGEERERATRCRDARADADESALVCFDETSKSLGGVGFLA